MDGAETKTTKKEESPKTNTELSDDFLASISVKKLNQVLCGLSKKEAFEMRHRRRSLKNRMYSRTMRTKRSRQTKGLEDERQKRIKQLEQLAGENEDLKRERDDTKKKCDSLR